MAQISRNDPCPCGSGKKYKNCCLEKQHAEIFSAIPSNSSFDPAALHLAGDNCVPAIACRNPDAPDSVVVLARASRPHDVLEAAKEAAADLESVADSVKGGSRAHVASYLSAIGYKVMEGASANSFELLEDLSAEDETVPNEQAESEVSPDFEGPPVSLRAVVTEMEAFSDECTAFLNRRTGELITLSHEELSAAEEGDEIDEDAPDWQVEAAEKARKVVESGDYLELPGKFDIHEYAIMKDFCESFPDTQLSGKMLGAIRGSGAFRRFKDVIHRHNIQDVWYGFRDQAFARIAEEWLEENGIPFVRDTQK